MISYQNLSILASVIFYLLTKLILIINNKLKSIEMHNKRTNNLLTIPETYENELSTKWVPKKRHEVLKAKYKCLKKLFQIYDANIMGVLPEEYAELGDDKEVNGGIPRRRRSSRTRTDASAGTDISSIDTAFKQDSSTNQLGDPESMNINKSYVVLAKDELTQTESEIDCIHNQSVPMYFSEKPKLTRFQILMKRLFGLRYYNKQVILPNGHVCAASEYNIAHCNARRRRRGIRLRRRPKKVVSEGMLESKKPEILSYVQKVQKNCLQDTTPRQCPILGCKMMFYGIINYNDHLNLCHFTGRKFSCHYCHEGFESEQDKLFHENEHLGIPKLILTSPLADRNSYRKANDTQTDRKDPGLELPRDKLKKIVSFFDKIVENEQQRCCSDCRRTCQSESNISSDASSDRKTCSCQSTANCRRPVAESETRSLESIKCQICGEHFEHRRQLCLHVDLEHKAHKKFSKNHTSDGKIDCFSTDGTLNVQSVSESNSTLCREETFANLQECSEKDGKSTNIVYQADSETVCRNNSTLSNIVQKVKSGIKWYKWEPGTKIIHV